MRYLIMLIALLVVSETGTASVIKVPLNYSTIQEAVDAAKDGDTILVAPAMYLYGFVITNKELCITTSKPGIMVSLGNKDLVVRDLEPAKTVMIIGFQMAINSFVSKDNLGTVRIEDCKFRGHDGIEPQGFPGEPGGDIINSHDVSFIHCTLIGGNGTYSLSAPGGPGLRVENSSLALYDCSLQGGDGMGNHFGGDGGDGYHATNTTLFASGCVFAGGDGGSAFQEGGNGGDGIHLKDAASVAHLLDCTCTGGEGGLAKYSGYPGVPIHGSNVHYFTGPAREFQMLSPAYENTTVDLTFDGQPDDLVGCFISSHPGSKFLPVFQGHLLMSPVPMPVFMILGSTSTGILDLSVPLPDYGPGFIATTIYLQSIFMAQSGLVTLGTLRTLPIVNDFYSSDTKTIYVPDEFPTIQHAIDHCMHGMTVLVAPGTYNENISFEGLAITVKSTDGPEVTVIDAGRSSGAYPVVSFQWAEGPDSVLDGFTIKNGVGLYNCGGGIYCGDNTSPIIKNNIITMNNANYGGGGIYIRKKASPTITGNVITNNWAGTRGGGIYSVDTSAPRIMNNIIKDNLCDTHGGGICTLGDVVITFCTIVNNQAAYGGGLSCASPSCVVSDTIFWDNSASSAGKEISLSAWPDPSTLLISYSDVHGGMPSVSVTPGCTLNLGPGLKNVDPLFVTGFYLSQIAAGQLEDSPCVDTGDPDAAMINGTTRTDQVQDAVPVDMGFHYPID